MIAIKVHLIQGPHVFPTGTPVKGHFIIIEDNRYEPGLFWMLNNNFKNRNGALAAVAHWVEGQLGN